MTILAKLIAILLIAHVLPLACLGAEAINGCHTLLQGYITGWIINACIIVAFIMVAFAFHVIDEW